jgi:hypothetical protein
MRLCQLILLWRLDAFITAWKPKLLQKNHNKSLELATTGGTRTTDALLTPSPAITAVLRESSARVEYPRISKYSIDDGREDGRTLL